MILHSCFSPAPSDEDLWRLSSLVILLRRRATVFVVPAATGGKIQSYSRRTNKSSSRRLLRVIANICFLHQVISKN
ncbi:hypothetical protein V6N11_031359 [Hibiscus sabdariffa]|uniref:Uncharacterized protein n=1 Tax=Hibiscus sabdariffa TaxID=183260 RepID=A0ABR2SY98_9ROSI